ELYERPESLFVAGFIGSPPMNFFELPFLREKGGSALPKLGEGATVIGIRPDRILLERPAAAAIALPAILELTEPVGGESHLHFRLEGSNQLVVVETPGRPNIAEGAEHTLHLEAPAMHAFSGDTGRRVN